MAIESHVHRLSSAEYGRMVESGALDELRVELLDGLLVDVSPQGERHARVIRRLMALCASRMDLLRVQMPLAVAEGWTPEPDLALAEDDREADRPPATARLVVEVAISSHALDVRKAAAYASAGVDRYWIVDLPRAVVLEHTAPEADSFGLVRRLTGDDVLDAGVPEIPTTTVAALLDGLT